MLKHIGLAGKKGAGKALYFRELVLTPKGWVEIGNLTEGDKVYSIDGKPTKVTGVFPQGRKQIYRVSTTEGCSVLASGDHLWGSYEAAPNKSRKDISIVTTLDIMNTLMRGDTRRHQLPDYSPINFPPQNVPLDPYLVGVLIGDGNLLQSSIKISSADREMLDTIKEILPKGYSIYHEVNYDYRISRGIIGRNNTSPLKEALIFLGLYGKRAWEKSVPYQYLLNNIECRISVLQGLMDTDGSIDSRGRHEFSTTSLQLAEDVVFLVRSLSGKASIKSRVTKFTYNGMNKEGRISYRVNINLPDNIIPYRLTRKVERCLRKSGDLQKERYRRRYISSVEEAGFEECVCISIEHPSGLFITKDFIVTHNTTLASLICSTHSYKKRHLADALREELVEIINTESSQDYISHLGRFMQAEINLHPQNPDIEKISRLYRVIMKYRGRMALRLMEDPATKEEFRELMQYYGTEVCRASDPDYWLDKMPWGTPMVIPDVRFWGDEPGSEVARVRAEGGKVLYIWNEEAEAKADPSHITEQMRPEDCDEIIQWDKTSPVTSILSASEALKKYGMEIYDSTEHSWITRLREITCK